VGDVHAEAASAVTGHPADWLGRDLATRTDWIHVLTAAELAELDLAIRTLRRSGKALLEIAASDFPLSALAPGLTAWRDALARGRGFVLVRGFPVRRYSAEDAALAYWIIGTHLGRPVSQNAEGDRLGHVIDTGADPDSLSTRLYRTRRELTFHTDGADLIGLFCLRRARSGGVSRIASSVAVYNELVRRRPDLAPLARASYAHYMPGAQGRADASVFQYPIVSGEADRFRMLFLGWYIRNAQTVSGVPALSREQLELIDLLEQIPEEPGIALDMSFEEGDIQFLKNSVILHARTEYEDFDEPDEKRHLLRLWLSAPDFLDGDDRLRQGVGGPAQRFS
jgi:hypothetical protein